ncbi:MAG: nucleoside deaminase [Gammaproteobacteria bacterium]
MFKQPTTLKIELPEWPGQFALTWTDTLDINQRMEFVISASQRSVYEGTGGPFAAAIFEQETGKLVALGINLVTTRGLSILHAEIVAITLAQTKLNTYDLGSGNSQYELVTSTEPCAMCLGAIPWSGITRIVTAARDEDARNIGFDEGAKPANWEQTLIDRGISVISNIQRDKACKVLELYKTMNGHIYNSRKDTLS